jgi:signal transduction histidine kinase
LEEERGLASQPGVALRHSQRRVSVTVRPRTRNRPAAAETDVRQWLARELHDSVAQTLTNMLVEIERFKAEQTGRQSALEQLDALQASTRHVLASLRQTMVILRDQPKAGPALGQWLQDVLERFQADTGIDTDLLGADSWPSSLSTQASINVCRIVEEALQNVRRHSGAQRVLISLSREGDLARLYIRDDGRGHATGSELFGLGTMGMKERALLLGGELRVESGFGNGTAIEVRIPAEHLTD